MLKNKHERVMTRMRLPYRDVYENILPYVQENQSVMYKRIGASHVINWLSPLVALKG